LLKGVRKGELVAKIDRNEVNEIDVENIVNTLLDYSGALEELISFIRLKDSGIKALQALETFQRVLLVDSSPSVSLTSPTTSTPLDQHRQERLEQLSALLRDAMTILGELERRVLFEADPLQRVNYELKIEQLKHDMAGYEQELAELETSIQLTVIPPAIPKEVTAPAQPRSYIPFPRDRMFQPRPGEFEKLEKMLLNPTETDPTRLGLVGVVGMGGVGKTRLAVELVYRCQGYFSDGVFWLTATGNQRDWQRELSDLSSKTGYLPSDDDPSHPENEARRARYICQYLAEKSNALLILDNVDDPGLVISALPALAGCELKCSLLYTSRVQSVPAGVTTHPVEELPVEAALHLILETTRPALLGEALAGEGQQGIEAQAARTLCRMVGYLPLALVHLRALLSEDHSLKLVRLVEALKEYGALEVLDLQNPYSRSLLATFRLSWEKVSSPAEQRIFKLASYFPEATPIPLWLLGLAANLGESGESFTPLGRAKRRLQHLSLLEELAEGQVRLHPLVREFGLHLVSEEPDKGKLLLEEAGKCIATAFENVNGLETRAKREGYWNCLEQAREALEYIWLLDIPEAGERLKKIEHWLDRNAHILGASGLWPEQLPSLFYQQMYNWAVEEGWTLLEGATPKQWIRLLTQVGAEDIGLIRTIAGHSESVLSTTFSPDGRWILTGASDNIARLWEATTGKPIITYQGHRRNINSVTFSPGGHYVLTGSDDNTARLWETLSGKLLFTFEGHHGPVRSVTFSPGGHYVLTGSDDNTARLWETATGKFITSFEGHTA
ncbi:MAG: NB-ARC domain-containing protein, partial [Chloroflexota bacterium]